MSDANLSPELPIIFRKMFSTDSDGDVRILGELLADNYSAIYIDNTLIKAQNLSQFNTNFINTTPIDTIISLSSGNHSIDLHLRNAAGGSNNPTGVRLSAVLLSCNSTLSSGDCSSTPIIANAGVDKSICIGESVQIGTPALTGYSYSWSEVGGSNISTGQARITVSPTATTSYYIAATINSATRL